MHAAAAECLADGRSLIRQHLQHTDNSQIPTTIYTYKYGNIPIHTRTMHRKMTMTMTSMHQYITRIMARKVGILE